MIKRILILIIITSFCSALFGQKLDRSLSKNDRGVFSLHFRFNTSLLERDYLNNTNSLAFIDNLFSDDSYLSQIDSISVYAATSPEGVLEHNSQLAYERSVAIRGYLMWKYPEVKTLNVNINSEVYRWSELISYVEQDATIPYKNSVIELLQNRDNVTRATIEWRLKAIGNGVVWDHITTHYLRYLRLGQAFVTIHVSHKDSTSTIVIPKKDSVLIETPIVIADTTQKVQEPQPILVPKAKVEQAAEECKSLFALKTNLLFDAISLINLELEVPIGKRFSIAGELIFPWWIFDNGKADSKRHRIQLLNANLEGRYWFGNREERPKMTGWFAGVYVGGGLYDFEHSAKGYQGEFFIMGGLSGGYAHTINKKGNLRMEYSLGIGYMQTDYRYYEAHFAPNGEWHALYNTGGRYSWFGPTKAKISLVWMLNKRGGRR